MSARTFLMDYHVASYKLALLRALDGMLDFSRSTIQLEILLFLGSVEGVVSASEIARRLGLRFKAVHDALYKLSSKGLVRRSGYGYTVTDKGRQYVVNLYRLLAGKGLRYNDEVMRREKLKLILENLVLAGYVYEALLILGASPRNEASLKTLSKLIGLSPSRLKSYLDVFTDVKDPKLRLFKRYTKARRFRIPLLRSGNSDKVYYRLTSAGLRELSKLSAYRRLKRNWMLRAMMRITLSLKKDQAWRRVIIVLCIGTFVSALSLLTPYGVLVMGLWLMIAAILSSLTLLADYITD